VHSVIPIFYSELGDLQVATDASAQLLHDCINAFEDAAEKLLRTYGNDEGCGSSAVSDDRGLSRVLHWECGMEVS